MNKPTQGPWRALPAVQDNGPNYWIVTTGQWRAPVVATCPKEADANFCAASREMFSALLECEALLLAHDYPVILRQVRAAMAKAEGKP